MSTVRAYQSGISDKSDAAFRPAFVNLSLSHVSEVLVYGQSKVFTGIVVIVLAIYLFRATESAGRFLEFFYSSSDALDFHGELDSYYRDWDIKGKIIGDNFVSAPWIRQRTHHTIRTFSSSNLHGTNETLHSPPRPVDYCAAFQ